jgi:glutamate dehydrogenase
MSLTNKTELASLIADIQAVAESKLSPKETPQLAGFFPIYFEETEHADLRQFSSLDLFGAALAHFEFARKRSAGQHKVRIYTPDFERDGWQSTHSVIEVVNDDMPFLIDSISMLLSRYNINLHLLVHPVLSVGRDKNGNLLEVKRTQDRSLPLESFIHVQIDRVSDAATLQKLEAELNRIIADIRLVVSDEPKMRAVVGDIGKDLAKVKGERAGSQGSRGFPRLDGGQSLPVHGLLRLRPGKARRQGQPEDRQGFRPGHPARPGRQGILRQL